MGRKTNKVLIVRPGALGDTLMLLPTLSELRGRSVVTVAGRRPGIDFLHDHAEEIHDMDGALWSRLFLQAPDPRGLPLSEQDSALVFMGDRGADLCQNLGAYLPGAAIHLHPSLPGPGKRIHAARHILDCARSSGLPVDPEAGVRFALERGLLGSTEAPVTGGRRLVFHPGSGSMHKNYSPAFWLNLIVALSSTILPNGTKPVVLLGPAEEALRPFFSARCAAACEIVWCPKKDALVSTLESAGLYIGHDSGITHLAAMLGVPTIALFRGSDPILWHPLGPRVVVLEQGDVSTNPIQALRHAAARATGPGAIKPYRGRLCLRPQ